MLRAEQFLATILADPESDDGRLVYADWLEEQGNLPRAEFIRAQVELARLPVGDRTRQELEWRADGLLARHGPRWRAELPELPGVVWRDFERGFVSTVRVLKPEVLWAQGEAIARAAPVYRVELLSMRRLDALRPEGSVPWLRTLRVVGTSEYGWTRRVKEHEGPTLASTVSEIELVGIGQNDDLRWLTRGGAKPALRSLRVEGEHVVGQGFARWVAGPSAAPLVRLDLGTRFIDFDSGYYQDPTLGTAGAEQIAGAAHLSGLEVLNVNRQRVRNEGLVALIRSPHLSKLRELHLRAIEVDDLSVLRELRGPVRLLDLSSNALTDAQVGFIVSSAALAGLEQLKLDMCELSADAVTALGKAPFWHTLVELDLSHNPLGLAGVRALAQAPTPEQLHTLRLADCDLDDQALEALLAIPWLRDLLQLDLSGNAAGSVTQRLGGGTLRALSLVGSTVDADGLADLLPQLVSLEVDGTALGDEGVARLLSTRAPHLQQLGLAKTGLTPAGLGALLRLECPALHSLSLAGNALGLDGLEALLSSPLAAQLVTLDLSSSSLDNAAASLLAASPALESLQQLDLRGHELSEEALLALARSPFLRKARLVRLGVTSWDMSEETRGLLFERFGQYWYHNPEDIEIDPFQENPPEGASAEEEEDEDEEDDDDDDGDDLLF